MLEFAESVLGSYSAVYVSRKRGAGLLFLAATLLTPAQGLCGLACAALAVGTARAFGYDRGLIRLGLFSFNALLIGLAVGHRYPPGMQALLLVLAGAVMAVLLTAAFQSLLEYTFNLPQLSLAFVLITLVLYASAGTPAAAVLPPGLPQAALLPAWTEAYLKAIAAVFFGASAASGALVFAGLLYASRISTALSLLGFAAGSWASASAALPPGMPDFAGFNYAMAAIAVGGIYCVPSPASYLLGALAAALCAPLAYGGATLALPFLAVTLAFIAALRMRPNNAAPELVFLPAPSPEDNLAVAQSRRLRAKGGWAGLRLPFIGTWLVTQGADGEHTHKGKWRHALDFALPADPPKEAPSLSAFPAFGLPVAAPQAGIVARIVDGLADNDPGAMDTERNWGNHITVQHADGSYSLLAHLKKGSLRVKPGDRVVPGEVLALCGNSGRSPTPHIHFHLQKTPEPGGETLPFAFQSYVRAGPEPALVENSVPARGESVENLVLSPAVRSAFDMMTGSVYRFAVERGGARHEESLSAVMDLYGNRFLESLHDGARLYYHLTADMFFFDYCSARPGSLLFALLLSASKVPLVEKRRLSWSDELPMNAFLRGAPRLATEFLQPFLPGRGVTVARRFAELTEEPEAEAAAGSGTVRAALRAVAPPQVRLAAIESRLSARFPAWIREARAQAVFCEGKGPLRVALESAAPGLTLTASRLPD